MYSNVVAMKPLVSLFLLIYGSRNRYYLYSVCNAMRMVLMLDRSPWFIGLKNVILKLAKLFPDTRPQHFKHILSNKSLNKQVLYLIKRWTGIFNPTQT
jgi:hypothetical protein